MFLSFWRKRVNRANKGSRAKGKQGNRSSLKGYRRLEVEALETRVLPAANPFFNLGPYTFASDSYASGGNSYDGDPASYVGAVNGNVQIPVRIDHLTDGTNTGMAGADVTVLFDPTVFDSATVVQGPLVQSGWSFTATPQSGEVSISTNSNPPSSPDVTGTDPTSGGSKPNGDILAYITLHISSSATAGTVSNVTVDDSGSNSYDAISHTSQAAYANGPDSGLDFANNATVTVSSTRPTVTLSIDTSAINPATSGNTYTVPILYNPSASGDQPGGSGLDSADATIFFDPTFIDPTSISVSAGSLVPASGWTANSTGVRSGTNEVNASQDWDILTLGDNTGTDPIAANSTGSLWLFTFRLEPTASGTTVLNLVPQATASSTPTNVSDAVGFYTLNPAPTNAPTDSVDGSITAVLSGPTLTSINPTAVTAGAPSTTITLNGTTFDSNATADFNGNPLTTTFVNSTQLTASIPASDLTTPGTAQITVVNPTAPNSGTSAPVNFTINPALTISAQPASATIDNGQSDVLSVTASAGTPPYSYQWYIGSSGVTTNPIAGATSSTFTASPGSTTSYWVHLTDAGSGTVNSNTATITVNPALTISAQPASATIDNAQSDLLSVTASAGTTPYSYQWYIGSSGTTTNPIGGATSSTFSATPGSTTSYWVKVTDSANGTAGPDIVDSNTATLTVNPALTISVQPASATIDNGQSDTLSMTASNGTTPYSYQWYIGLSGVTTNPIAGATSSTFSASPGTSTSYWVKVTDSANGTAGPGFSDSNTATLTVNPALTISAQPASASIDVGQSDLLSVTASNGTTPYSYQWYIGSSGTTTNPIAGATSSTFNATPGTTTSYWVKVTDSANGTAGPVFVDSNTATITVNALPSISVQPASATIDNGQSDTLSVTATNGTTPYTYQWYIGLSGDTTNPIAGATSSTFFASPGSTTSYWVLVTDATNAAVDSNTATLTVNPTLTISVQPASATIDNGQSDTLSVTASNGTTPYSYQWYIGLSGDTTNPIAGASSSTFSATPGSTTSYWVQVLDSANGTAGPGFVNSNTATITVNAALGIATQPASASIDLGQSDLLSVTASNGTTPYSYQWYTGLSGVTTNPIAGATSSTFTGSPSSTTSYWVQVTDATTATVNSNTATITVNPALTISAQPASATIDNGQSDTLSVTASSGTTPYSYQWYIGASGVTTNPIAGASSSTFSASPSSTTSYWVKVTDSANGTAGAGFIDSNTATLTVNPALTISAQPASASIDVGQSDTLSVTASNGTTPYSYQWYIGLSGTTTSPIAGATSSTFNATPGSTTSYWVQVTDSANGTAGPDLVDSNTATITVNAALGIATQPASASIDVGQSDTLSVVPSNGTTPYSYQWYIGLSGDTTNPIGGATSSTFSASPGSTTSYWVQVTDATTVTVDSNTATLTVNAALTISVQPASATIDNGQIDTLSVTASNGTTPYSYQWYIGLSGDITNPIAGASSSTFNASPSSTTSYWVQVTDSANGTAGPGFVDSNTATITVNAALGITVQPTSASIDVGQSDTLSVTASNGTTPYSYQWYFGLSGDTTNPIGGATSSTFSATPGSTTSYWVQITDATNATVNSNTATLTVNPALTISAQPASATIDNVQSDLLSVTASNGTTPYSYQWYIGASGVTTNPIAGATSSTFNATPGSTTSYWVQVTDSANGTAGPDFVDSNTATLTVNPALTISAQPASASIDVGQSDTLSVTASNGTTPYSYQWYIGTSGVTTNPIAGATSSTFSATPGSTTSYWVQVTDSANGTAGPSIVDSNTATITVNAALGIATQPASATIDVGQSDTLSVTASTGTTPYSYQWYFGLSGDTTSPIGGATSSTFSATPGSTTSYWVQVTDATNATVNSNTATLTVNAALTISAQPASATIDNGQIDTLSVTASNGTTPYSYQWYIGSSGVTTNPIAGASSSTFNAAPSSTTSYWVQVTDSANGTAGPGFVDSNTATITVNAALGITVQPTSASIDVGQSDTLSVTASNGTTPYSYQWYIGTSGVTTNPIGGATSSTFSASPGSTTSYWVQITDATDATVNSNTATLTVNPALTISAQPASATIDNGQSDTLSVTASSGTPAYSYQWYIGSSGVTTNPIAGATSSTFNATPGSTTSYWVKVTDSADGTAGPSIVDSNTATLTVNPALTISVQPASATIDAGETDTLSVTASGGTTPYSYQWYIGSSGVTTNPIAGATSSTFTASPSSTTSYWVQVTDSADGTAGPDFVDSNTDTITLHAALGIATQPASASIDVGQSDTLSVVPSNGTTPYSYQWYIGLSGDTTNPIGGATSSTFSASPGSTTSYWVQVTDATNATVNSNTATLTVNPALTISAQPTSATINSGQSDTLSVTASNGTTPYSYQWYIGSSGVTTNPIAGATSSTFSASPSSSTNYWVQVTDSANGTAGPSIVGSNTATITVTAALGIATQPASASIDVGQSDMLSVTASGGTPAYSYQWYIGTSGVTTNPIAGATNSTFSATPGSTTSYWVKVTDATNTTVNSNTATLTVNPALTISAQPASATIDNGQSDTLSVTASGGTTPYSYQWYIGSSGVTTNPIAGATSSTFSASPSSSTSYWVQVTDSANGTAGPDFVDSNTATLTVNAALSISAQPAGASINSGQSDTLSVKASGGTTPYSYQWYIGSSGVTTNPIAGATSSTFNASPKSTTSYWVLVTDSANGTAGPDFVDSNTATITINTINNPVPTLTSISPSSATVGAPDTTITLTGSNFLSSSTADFNGTAIATTFVSATQLTAVIPAVDLTTAGTEPVTVVTPGPGGGTSAAQTFTINNPVPSLTSISPTSATAGATDTTITLTGTGFVSSSTADFNGTALATTFVSATQLTAVIPAADLTTAGTDPVTVVNPSPGGGTSGAQTFTINASSAQPASITAAPSSTPQSATVGDPMPNPLVVTVLDANGKPVAGVTVTFTVSASGTATGSFTNGSTTITGTTDSNGVAEEGFTANNVTGSYTVTASVVGVKTPASFSLTNVPGPAFRFTLTVPSSADAGTAVTATMTALDEFNNTATGYAGTVHFTSSDVAAVLPANAKLTAGSGSFSVTLNTAGAQTVTTTDTANGFLTTSGSVTVSGAAPTTSNTWLQRVYLDLLGRPLDPTGQAFWTGLLNNGATQADVANGIEASPEYQTRVVETLYQELFGRAADPTGLSTWTAFLANGGTIEQLKANLLGSTEYANDTGGSDAGFLAGVYQFLLGRAGDPAGIASWEALLASGASRESVALAIATSAEAENELVEQLSTEFLRRDADPSGLSFFGGERASGVTDQAVIANMLASGEYNGLTSTSPQPVSVFLDRVYVELLNRPLDQAGLTFWGGLLSQGTSAAAVIAGVEASVEFRTDQIEALYESLLGRQADPTGLQSWLQFLANGGTLAQIRSFILGSSEFQSRA